jgi:hypothetical protein
LKVITISYNISLALSPTLHPSFYLSSPSVMGERWENDGRTEEQRAMIEGEKILFSARKKQGHPFRRVTMRVDNREIGKKCPLQAIITTDSRYCKIKEKESLRKKHKTL